MIELLFSSKPLRRAAVLARTLAAATPLQAGGVLLQDAFTRSDGLETNEFAFWNPGYPGAAESAVWEADSGSFFNQGGTGWTGRPDDVSPNILSSNGTNSAVFRLNTKRSDFRNVAVSFLLRNNGLSTSPSTPAQDWDGLHVWLRYQSETKLYYASVNRRSNTVIIKKKVPGGPSNGGTYYELCQYAAYTVPYGRWQSVKATVADNPDGSVQIRLYINDILRAQAVDNGTIGGAPIREAGKVGIRGDNANLSFDNFTVTDLTPSGGVRPAAPAGVTAAAGDSRVTNTWNAVPGATSYNLYRSRFPGVTKETGYKVADVTSPHVNTGFTNGTRYYMVVTAVNAAGESPVSAEVSAVPSLRAPAAPGGVTARPGDARVTLSWNAVAGAASYNIYRSRYPGVTKATAYKITNAMSPFVNTGFSNGTRYYLAVSAVNAAGEGPLSAEVSATPYASAASLSPQSLLGAADGLRAYPNPWRADQHAGVPITFDGLGEEGRVRVMTVTGEPVATLAGARAAAWDPSQAASGLYVYVAEGPDGRKKQGKIAVIR